MKSAIWILLVFMYLCVPISSDIIPSDCQNAFQKIIFNKNLLKWFMFTGKEQNDLGDYNQCTKNFVYGTMRIVDSDQQITSFIGICLPVECTKEDYDFIADIVNYLINPLGYSVIPYYNNQIVPDVTSGNEFGIFLIAIILCLITFGVLIEYSTLFDIDRPNKKLPIEQQKTKTGLFFLAFSITRNMRTVFGDPSPAQNTTLRIFDGIRVISFLWVMLGHGYTTLSYTPVINSIEIRKFIYPWGFAIVNGGFYAVDVFFFISAFLGAYLLLIKCSTGNDNKFQKINFIMIYFHRIYRLLPPMLLFIVFYITFYKYIGNGPVWAPLANDSVDGCIRDWWTHAIFLGNILPLSGNQCLSWLWFVSCDMQFFIFLPVQIWLYTKKKFAGYSLAIFILFCNMVTVFLLSNEYNISTNK